MADLFRERYLAGGVDFAAVRVHAGGAFADRACRALGARAFTTGPDIYFAAGQFRPGTRDGLWLLAHEVAHVVQQSAGLPGLAGTGDAAGLAGTGDAAGLAGTGDAAGLAGTGDAAGLAGTADARGPVVLPPGTPQEHAADAAADALLAGRRYEFRGCVATGRVSPGGVSPGGVSPGGVSPAPALATVAGRPAVQRYMAWEHSMLGDVDPARVAAAAGGDQQPVAAYRELLAELGQAPQQADEARPRAADAGTELIRLPGSGLVLTLGELNVLPDYLGRPEEIETAPAGFVGPLIQSVRSWSVAELDRSARLLGERGAPPRSLSASLATALAAALPTVPRLLPGSLRYPLFGPLAETAEIPAISRLGGKQGFAPARKYAAVLARNAGHFAPFSWYRWHEFHLMARELIARSGAASGQEREALRLRARICAGYADHFLQDSFAAGHLVNKTQVIQWYIEWLAENGVDYPARDALGALTVRRQPLLHGPGHYDRAAARSAALLGGMPGTKPGGVTGPPWDAQDVADIKAPEERIAASGVTGDSDADRHAAYQAYLVMLRSGTVQLAVKVAHEYLNKNSLVVSSGHLGHRFRLNGDHTLLADPAGALRAAQAAAASRRAISELLRDGETSVDSWDIFDSFPDHVEQGGRMVSLPEWHRTGLRELCFELFALPSTRAVRGLMSAAFRQLGTPVDDLG